MQDFNCEHPQHEGGRRVRLLDDQCVVTVDIMSADGRHRHHRVGPRLADVEGAAGRSSGGVHMCRVCADRTAGALRAGAAALELGLAWQPVVQAAL